jgi:hypothetical protein
MWFLGILLTILLAGINQVFEYRAPSVFITSIVGQLISLPMGKFLEWVLPSRQFKTLNYVWSFNPGPFNIKVGLSNPLAERALTYSRRSTSA